MTSPIVVDASVAVAFVHPERHSADIRRAVDRWQASGHGLVVPGHFWLEVINALGRRYRYSSAEVVEALRELDQLGLETLPMEPVARIILAGLMERFELTSYDAAYLALADVLDARLATLDGDLASTAGARWLDPLGSDRRPRLSEAGVPYGTERPETWPHWAGAGAYLAELRARARAAPQGSRRKGRE